MYRTLTRILALVVIVAGSSLAVIHFGGYWSAEKRIQQLEQQKQQLERVVQRLSTERRVAEVMVTEQKTVNGVLQTTLLFVEYARDGHSPLPPKRFVIEGEMAHIDALVIKFENDLVARDDPLRGHSIALFTRLYGDHQSPADAAPIDTPGQIPDIYKGSSPQVSQFEQDLWASFWRLADDAAYRKSRGVRVANGQSVWGPFRPDRIYTLTIESNGGVNITSRPIEPIFLEALKRHAPSS
jgi:hypothetical protein